MGAWTWGVTPSQRACSEKACRAKRECHLEASEIGCSCNHPCHHLIVHFRVRNIQNTQRLQLGRSVRRERRRLVCRIPAFSDSRASTQSARAIGGMHIELEMLSAQAPKHQASTANEQDSCNWRAPELFEAWEGAEETIERGGRQLCTSRQIDRTQRRRRVRNEHGNPLIRDTSTRSQE